jgi:predicted transcriptional regulator
MLELQAALPRPLPIMKELDAALKRELFEDTLRCYSVIPAPDGGDKTILIKKSQPKVLLPESILSTIMDYPQVIMSVHRKYARLLMTGKKTIELRKNRVKIPPGSRVWFYVTGKWKRIMCTAIVSRVQHMHPSTAWAIHERAMAMNRSEFDSYTSSHRVVSAIYLENAEVFIGPSLAQIRRDVGEHWRPPQSYTSLRRGTTIDTVFRVMWWLESKRDMKEPLSAKLAENIDWEAWENWHKILG